MTCARISVSDGSHEQRRFEYNFSAYLICRFLFELSYLMSSFKKQYMKGVKIMNCLNRNGKHKERSLTHNYWGIGIMQL